MNLRAINYENGLSCVDINLSESIVSYCDYSKKDIKSLKVFLDSIPILKQFRYLTEAYLSSYFGPNLINYYSVRDLIMNFLRETNIYLDLRLKYITDRYDVNVNIQFINTIHRYEVSASYLYSDKIVNIRDYSDIMDSLDVLEVSLEDLKSSRSDFTRKDRGE